MNIPGVELLFADPEFIEERAEDLIGVVADPRARGPHRRRAVFRRGARRAALRDAVHRRAGPRKLEEAGIANEIELNVIEREHGSIRPRAVRGHLCPARALDRRGQRAADRDPVRPRVPHRRLEARRRAADRHTRDRRGTDRDRRRGRARDGVRFDQRVQSRPARARKARSIAGCSRKSARHAGKRVLVTTFASNVARLQTLGRCRPRDRARAVRRRALARPDHRGRAGQRLPAGLPASGRFRRGDGPAARQSA